MERSELTAEAPSPTPGLVGIGHLTRGPPRGTNSKVPDKIETRDCQAMTSLARVSIMNKGTGRDDHGFLHKSFNSKKEKKKTEKQDLGNPERSF